MGECQRKPRNEWATLGRGDGDAGSAAGERRAVFRCAEKPVGGVAAIGVVFQFEFEFQCGSGGGSGARACTNGATTAGEGYGGLQSGNRENRVAIVRWDGAFLCQHADRAETGEGEALVVAVLAAG